MEVNREEKKSSRREDEEKEVNYPLLNSPCTAFHRTVQAILKCLGLESSYISPSSSSSEDPGTEIVSSFYSQYGLLIWFPMNMLIS